jgi:hypothetical protein
VIPVESASFLKTFMDAVTFLKMQRVLVEFLK